MLYSSHSQGSEKSEDSAVMILSVTEKISSEISCHERVSVGVQMNASNAMVNNGSKL
jgi:hypothetical protein